MLASAQGRMAGVRPTPSKPSLARARADHPEAPVDRLEGAWDDQLTTAAGLRAQVLEAAQRAAVSIRAAGPSSPTADQSWLADGWEDGGRWLSDRVDDLKNFVAEHAGGLRVLGKALRWVGMALVAVGAALAALSLAAGVLSFGIGWLGEIPAGAVLGAGRSSGALATPSTPPWTGPKAGSAGASSRSVPASRWPPPSPVAWP